MTHLHHFILQFAAHTVNHLVGGVPNTSFKLSLCCVTGNCLPGCRKNNQPLSKSASGKTENMIEHCIILPLTHCVTHGIYLSIIFLTSFRFYSTVVFLTYPFNAHSNFLPVVFYFSLLFIVRSKYIDI